MLTPESSTAAGLRGCASRMTSKKRDCCWLWDVRDRYYCVSDADGRRHDFSFLVSGGRRITPCSPMDG